MSEQPTLYLEIIAPDGAVSKQTLDAAYGLANIGQHPDNEIRLEGPGVADFHALVDYRQQPYQLIPLSTNATIFTANHQQLTAPIDWLPGNSILIGPFVLIPSDGVLLKEHPQDSAGANHTQEIPKTAAPVDSANFYIGKPQAKANPEDKQDTNKYIRVEAPKREQWVDVRQTAVWTIIVTNDGPRTAKFQIELYGHNGSEWVHLPPDDEHRIYIDFPLFNLNNNDNRVLTIQITPPRSRASLAGWYRLRAEVKSSDYGEAASYIGLSLQIRPYENFHPDPPRPLSLKLRFRGQRRNCLELPIVNRGNSKQSLKIKGEELTNACKIEFGQPFVDTNGATDPQREFAACDPKRFTKVHEGQHIFDLAAASTTKIPVRIIPRRRYWFGANDYIYQVRFEVGTEDNPALQFDRVGIEHAPLLRRSWRLPIYLLLIALAITIGFMKFFQPRIYEPRAMPTPQSPKNGYTPGQHIQLQWETSPFAGDIHAIQSSPHLTKTLQVTPTIVTWNNNHVTSSLVLTDDNAIAIVSVTAKSRLFPFTYLGNWSFLRNVPLLGDLNGITTRTTTLTIGSYPIVTISGPITVTSGSSVTVGLRITPTVQQTATVDIVAQNSRANANRYYQVGQQTVTIPPQSNAATFPISVTSGIFYTGSITFTLALTNAPQLQLGKPSTTTVIISRTNISTLSLKIDNASGWESGKINFPVHLLDPMHPLEKVRLPLTVTVDYEMQDVTAVAGRNYKGNPGKITLPPFTDSVTITVDLLHDNMITPDKKQFKIELKNCQRNRLLQCKSEDLQAIGTITDIDGVKPVVRIGNVTANEKDGLIQFPIMVNPPTTQELHLNFIIGNPQDSAKANQDYLPPPSSTVIIPPGKNTASLPIRIIQDDLAEPEEFFTVQLSQTDAISLAQETAIGTIIDTNGPPDVTITNTEANEGDGAIDFTIKLSHPSTQDITIPYKTQDGTAIAGSDYIPASGTLTIKAGESSTTLSIKIIDDNVVENDETFFVVLSNVSNATLASGTATGTILDNDNAATPTPTTQPSTPKPTAAEETNDGNQPTPVLTPTWTPVPPGTVPPGETIPQGTSRAHEQDKGNVRNIALILPPTPASNNHSSPRRSKSPATQTRRRQTAT